MKEGIQSYEVYFLRLLFLICILTLHRCARVIERVYDLRDRLAPMARF